MKFFNIDMHISVIADMKKIFQSLGHEVDDISLSDHTWVFNREKGSIPLLNNGNWMRLSSEEMADGFYDTYKNDLDKYDAFIVTYPPAFAFLYKHFNKPMIVNIPIRYEWPFTFRPEEWSKLTNYLVEGHDSGKIILVANNLTDKVYAERFLNREINFIPSLCDYFPEQYTGNKDEVIYYAKNRVKSVDDIGVRYKQDVLNNHTYEELLDYRAIVHIPYTCSYMSVFEQYSANVPLFVPDLDFLMKLYSENLAFSEISFVKMYGAPPTSNQFINSNQDPNNYLDLAIIRSLAEGSDFYSEEWMPHTQKFSSVDHLSELLRDSNCKDISLQMSKEATARKEKIHKMWSSLLGSLK